MQAIENIHNHVNMYMYEYVCTSLSIYMCFLYFTESTGAQCEKKNRLKEVRIDTCQQIVHNVDFSVRQKLQPLVPPI